MYTMETEHSERFGMILMSCTSPYIDMMGVTFIPRATLELSTWLEVVLERESKYPSSVCGDMLSLDPSISQGQQAALEMVITFMPSRRSSCQSHTSLHQISSSVSLISALTKLADHQSLLDLTLLKVISLVNVMFPLLHMDT
jgi:hypothetical protein